jgi:hypothetical protein
MIRSTGSSISNGGGVGSAGMSPVGRWMCLGRARNESPLPECNYEYEWVPHLTCKLYLLSPQPRDSEFSAYLGSYGKIDVSAELSVAS